jgi:pimeloyl-ACP methyl ester carboxylesterase
MLRAIGAGVLALTMSACMVVRIDETSVFHPVPHDAELAARSGQTILGEQAFRSDADWTKTWASRAEADAGFPKTPAPYVAASVEHGRFGTNEGGLAYTLLTRAAASDTLVVRCGGNASTRQRSGYRYTVVAIPYGDVLLFDYPGYGETGGEATPHRFQNMATELVGLVREKAAGRNIVLWGHSLGGLVCSELAARLPETDGLIIETSARNAREVAQAWTPWYAAPFVRIEIAEGFGDIDVANALKDFKGPVLVLGGEKDETLPVQLARSVGKALSDGGVDAEYVEFKKGGHSDLIVQDGFASAVAAFFAKVRAAQ